MSVRIITIDPTCEEHWGFAKRNGFWDLLNNSSQLHPDDVVVFWVTGSPGTIVGRAVVDSEPEPIARDSPHAWERPGPPQGDVHAPHLATELRRRPEPARALR
jgi:hypothetical protein